MHINNSREMNATLPSQVVFSQKEAPAKKELSEVEFPLSSEEFDLLFSLQVNLAIETYKKHYKSKNGVEPSEDILSLHFNLSRLEEIAQTLALEISNMPNESVQRLKEELNNRQPEQSTYSWRSIAATVSGAVAGACISHFGYKLATSIAQQAALISNGGQWFGKITGVGRGLACANHSLQLVSAMTVFKRHVDTITSLKERSFYELPNWVLPGIQGVISTLVTTNALSSPSKAIISAVRTTISKSINTTAQYAISKKISKEFQYGYQIGGAAVQAYIIGNIALSTAYQLGLRTCLYLGGAGAFISAAALGYQMYQSSKAEKEVSHPAENIIT